MATLTKKQQADRDEAIVELRTLCPMGTRVYTVLRHVSRSGMLRHIDVYVIHDNEPRWISSLIHRAQPGHYTQAKDGSLKVTGCGMDMGFSVVYNLSSLLYKADDGGYSHDGAYSLKQSWM